MLFARSVKWTFPVSLMERWVNRAMRPRTEFSAMLLTKHLFIEEVIVELCRRSVKSPAYLEHARLGFDKSLSVRSSCPDPSPSMSGRLDKAVRTPPTMFSRVRLLTS